MSDPFSVSGDIAFRDLQAFLAVASTGSFRAAAAGLHTSQPAVSRAIARLEKELGARVIERGPRGAHLTAAGVTLLQYARRIGSLVAGLRADLQHGFGRSLRLGAAATAAWTYLAPFLAEWIPSHPDVRIEVVEDGSGAMRERLLAGECDLAIIALPAPSGYESIPLVRVAVRVYFPAGHPLDDDSAPITVPDLARHRLLLNSVGFLSERLLAQEFEDTGVIPEVAYRSGVGQTLAAMAEAGLGVAVMASSLDLRGFDLRSRPVCDRNGQELGFTLAAAWHRTSTADWVKDFGRALVAHHSDGAVDGRPRRP